MKTVVNTTNHNLYLVVNGNDVKLPALQTVTINPKGSFGSDDFYVDGDSDDKWTVDNKENELHLRLKRNGDYSWDVFGAGNDQQEASWY